MKPRSLADVSVAPKNAIPGRGFQIAVSVALVLAALVVTCLANPDWNPVALGLFTKRTVPKPPLHLHANSVGEEFQISWSGDAQAIQRAKRAVLFINDGGMNRRHNMSLPDLRKGRLTYQPTSPEVRFRLEVVSEDGNPVSESIIALGGMPPAKREAAPAGENSFYQASVDRRIQVDSNPKPRKEPAQFRLPPQSVLSAGVRSTPVTVSPVLPPPPNIRMDTTASVAPGLKMLDQAGPRLSYSGPPPPSINASANTSRPRIVTEKSNPVAMVEPRAIRQIQPQIPADVRNMIVTAQTIDVRVSINEAGQVVKATVIGARGALTGLLTPDSLSAARHWLFRPARLANQNIASEHTISFVFSPRQ